MRNGTHRRTFCGELSTASCPDMITAAKALGNGFPVSALLMSRRVADPLKYDDMGTTFGGGPMACAVAEAVIDTIESESLLANVRAGLRIYPLELHDRSGDRLCKAWAFCWA